jgi:hypothetical protein
MAEQVRITERRVQLYVNANKSPLYRLHCRTKSRLCSSSSKRSINNSLLRIRFCLSRLRDSLLIEQRHIGASKVRLQ